MATNNQDPFRCCYQNWMTQQHQDLEELLHALTSDPSNSQNLHHLTEKSIKHFQDYHDTRAELAQHDAISFFCPSWCTSFESSLLWIGGNRPSLSIRLLYSLCGSEIESQLADFLQGERRGNLGEITATQLNVINEVHCRIVREEDEISTLMASLQEDVADDPLFLTMNESLSRDVDRVLDAHVLALARILGEADELRLRTLKELVDILTPLQAVDLLVASKKLHLSIHEWGKRRDLNMGRK